MGIHRGPNTVKDGLVFGYDTGYGVADNSTATRFYPGEATANLLDYDSTFPAWPSSSSNMVTLTTKTSPNSFTVIGTCDVPGAQNFIYPTILTNTAFHTLSATFTNNSTETSNVTLYIRGASNATSVVNQSVTITLQPGQSIRKTLVGTVLTNNSGYTAAIGVFSHGTSGQVNMNVTDVQFEEKTHATPFVIGTRSSTASLIDLKRTTNIDVSNVSFDSTGQPTFDGTDDYILTPYTRGTLGDTLTMIAYYKYTGGSSRTYTPIFGGIESSTEFFIGKNSGNTSIGVQDGNYNGGFVTGSNAWDGNYHQLVYTYENGTGKIYLDGVLKSSGSFTKCNTAEVISVGRESEGGGYYFLGDIPRACVYNKVFSASEILQDFNANKNRFNI